MDPLLSDAALVGALAGGLAGLACAAAGVLALAGRLPARRAAAASDSASAAVQTSVVAERDRLAVVARRTSNAVVITDPQRRIVWVNAGFERLTGYAAEEVMGQSPGQLLQCEATDTLTVQRIRQALDSGQSFTGEILNQSRTGRRYWLAIEIQPLRDGHGALTGFMAMQSDITERRESEAALRASQAFLDRAGRIAGVGGWGYDLASGQMQFTDQTCRILDLEPGHTITLDTCLALLDGAARREVDQVIARGLEHATAWDMELSLRTVRGRVIWVHVSAEIEYADSGPVRIVGALQDITARRGLRAEVERNARLLRAAIDAIDEAFVLFDPEDRLVLCNEKYRQMYALSADLMVPGTPFESIIRIGAERGQYQAAVGRVDEWVDQRMRRHRGANGVPTIQQLSDGRVVRIIEQRLPDGHTVGFRIDITDLVRATEAAESADRAKSEFIATVSHELRTPLQSILGFSSLGRRFAESHVQFGPMFNDIHGAGERMLTLVNGLLDISRTDNTLQDLSKQRHDLMRLAAEVVVELGVLASERQLRLELPDPLPRMDVEVDAFRLQQVIRNVLANALRFAPAGSAITLDGRWLDADRWELTIADCGPGIPVEELEAIFEPFTQSSRTRDGSGGSGLGLTICRKIMRAHGGAIHASNRPAHQGGGSCFHLQLPAAAAAPLRRNPVSASPVLETL